MFLEQINFKDPAVQARLTFAILLIIIDVAVASFIPYYSKLIVDSLAMNISNAIWTTVVLFGILWILEKTITHIQDIIFFPIINNTIRDLTYRVVEHIHCISLPDHQKLSVPEIINCIRRISMSARSFIKVFFLMIFPTIIKLFIAILVTIHMGLFGFLLLPTILLATYILYKGTQWYITARELAWQTTDKVIMRVHDSILNTKMIRPFQFFEMNHLKGLLDLEAERWYNTNTKLHTIYIIIGLLLGATITIILSSAIISIQKQNLTIGDFILLKGQLIAAFLPFKIFSNEFRQLAESLIDIKKIIQIFEITQQKNFERILIPNSSSSKSSKDLLPGIVCEKITFSHHHKNPIFKNLSLQIPFGQKVGIVGKTGCGKSTLINLISSLYKPDDGSIYIQGQNIHATPKKHLKTQVHCIPQDFRLFNLSLSYNVTYGLNSVCKADLLKAIEEVGLMEVIQQMPKGLDTVVGEMGIKLSAGEKQKVALARALLLKPDVLLLDETTNSLNTESERAILNILFYRIPTIILASHRLSTLNVLDQILKIEEGTVTEIHTLNTLNDSPIYHAETEYA